MIKLTRRSTLAAAAAWGLTPAAWAQGLPAVQAQMLRLLPGIEFSVEAGREPCPSVSADRPAAMAAASALASARLAALRLPDARDELHTARAIAATAADAR